MKRKKTAATTSLLRGIGVVAGCLVMAVPAFAQVETGQLPGQTREELDPARQAPALQPRVIDPAALAVAGSCPFAGQGSVTLSRIEVTGATLVPQGELDAAVADLVGTPGDARLLCTARDRVAAVYASHGEALARVDLPEQRMTDGVLTLRVTEGRITSVAVENAEAQGPSAALAQAYLEQLKSEGATRWADVERAFLLTREIPGADVRFSMRRADDGSADGLQATASFAERRKLDAIISAQNLGSEELGRTGVSARLDANSFTRLGERTSLVLFSTTSGAQQVAQLMEEVRLGASGWTAFGDVAYGRSRPEGALEALDLDGSSLIARLGARYPIVKTRDAMLDGTVRIESIDQDNDLGFLRGNGGPTISLFDESLRVLSMELAGRWRHGTSGALGSFGRVEVRKGLDALGASRTGDALLSRADAKPDFTSVRVDAGARVGVVTASTVAPYLMVNLSGQWTKDSLPAYEEFQVGNYTVGRGYDPGAASGDRAIAAQMEWGADFAAGNAQWGVFAFVDAARLWNEDPTGYTARPWSTGFGMRVRWRAGQLTATFADPQRTAFPGAPAADSRVLVTFTHAFSIR